MPDDIVIRVENLGKRYVLGRETRRAATFAGRVCQTVASPFSWLTSQMRGPSEDEILWALKDVSFEVKRGEVLGVIGRNGAGKSTLLKILSRITEPTTGHAEIHGRIAALLEVGTGMHPELTGRENIYLNGTILGMRKFEIDSKFDEIVDFSGIERFLDTPAKRYSSGMRVRLGFAIAAHLEPEILVIDEVLAVGDAEFQKKCLGKIKDVAGHGRTVLFVSHNMRAIMALCDSCILLDGGCLSLHGTTDEAMQEYRSFGRNAGSSALFSPPIGSDPFRLLGCALESSGHYRKDQFLYSEEVVIRLGVECQTGSPWPRLGVAVADANDTVIFATHVQDASEDDWTMARDGRFELAVSIPGSLLNIGRYRVKVAAHYPNVRVVFCHEGCLEFSVVHDACTPGSLGVERPGFLLPTLRWQVCGFPE